MEFHTEREEALYTTLQHVLHNHVRTHRLSYHETFAVCVSVLGYVLYVLIDSWEDAPGLIAETLAELQQRTHRRTLQALPVPQIFQDYAPRPVLSPQYHELGTALATFLATSGIEQNMSVAATWRAYLSLVADILAMPFHAGEKTLEEVDASIDTLRDQLPVVMRLWDEEGSEEQAEE
jgi:hypothetical protein